MITEDNKGIYLESIDDLDNLNKLKNSRYGSNSDIYFYNGILLKIYNHLVYISDIKNIEKIKKIYANNVSIPKKNVYVNNKICGYSMDYKKGVVLSKISENILYDTFISGLDEVNRTIRLFSDNKIEMIDFNCFNLLYDEKNNQFNIVDVDCYKENKYKSANEIYIENLLYFEEMLLSSLSFEYIVNNDLYKELKYLLFDSIQNGVSIVEAFKSIKKYIESYGNNNLNTLKDFKKILKKHNK